MAVAHVYRDCVQSLVWGKHALVLAEPTKFQCSLWYRWKSDQQVAVSHHVAAVK